MPVLPFTLGASLIGLIAALITPSWSNFIIFAAFAALAVGLLIFFRAIRGRRKPPAKKRKWIVIDGSNVMYWNNKTPRVQTIQDVVDHLTNLGFTPGVMFDANAGYLLGNKYFHDDVFCQLLGLPQDQVMVVPKGTPADPYILTAARDLGARVVTNDKFRDWIKDYPEVRQKEHLIKGGYRSGKLFLNMGKNVRHKPAAVE